MVEARELFLRAESGDVEARLSLARSMLARGQVEGALALVGDAESDAASKLRAELAEARARAKPVLGGAEPERPLRNAGVTFAWVALLILGLAAIVWGGIEAPVLEATYHTQMEVRRAKASLSSPSIAERAAGARVLFELLAAGPDRDARMAEVYRALDPSELPEKDALVAIEALRSLGQSAAIDVALARALERDAREVRDGAANAIRGRRTPDDPRALDLIGRACQRRPELLTALAPTLASSSRVEDREVLLDAVDEKDPAARLAALRQVRYFTIDRYGPRTRRAILIALGSDDREARQAGLAAGMSLGMIEAGRVYLASIRGGFGDRAARSQANALRSFSAGTLNVLLDEETDPHARAVLLQALNRR